MLHVNSFNAGHFNINEVLSNTWDKLVLSMGGPSLTKICTILLLASSRLFTVKTFFPLNIVQKKRKLRCDVAKGLNLASTAGPNIKGSINTVRSFYLKKGYFADGTKFL